MPKQIRLNKRDTSEILKRDPAYRATKQSMMPNPEGLPTRTFENKKDVPSPKSTGLRLPNGNTFQGTPEEERVVMEFFNRRKADREKEAGDKAKIQESINYDKLKKQMEAEQTPPNVTAEQLASVGKPGVLPVDETTQSIEENIRRREEIQQAALEPGYGSQLKAIGNVNKLTAFAGKLPVVGSALMNFLGQNKDVRAFLEDYSNENNYESVVNDIKNAKNNIQVSIRTANQPGDSDLAITDFNNAIARLNKANAQLYLIERGDQRKYTETVKNKRVELENYLTYNVPQLTTQMQNALVKPDPNYFNTELSRITSNEGVIQ